MARKIIIGLLGFAGLTLGIWFILNKEPLFQPPEEITSPVLYEGVGKYQPTLSIFSEKTPQVTQIEITPDGQYMLVGSLSGTILVYQRIEDQWLRQTEPFFSLETAQPGFPPEEAGLTGVALGADFEKSGDIFLNYSFAFEAGSFRNRVTRITFSKKGKKVVGQNPVQIFEAKTPGTGSHQIQDGVGVLIEDKPHLLFTIGEGFDATRALNPREEAGKVMLIDREGKTPVGTRAFPDSPFVQALGIRNAPGIAKNPQNGMIAITDTGPNNNDRFLYGNMFDPKGSNTQTLNLNWDGNEQSLEKNAQDLYAAEPQNMLLHTWAPTETAVSIGFFDHPKLPELAQNQQYALVVLFGRTGELGNDPGKKVLLATITHGSQNKIAFEPFVARSAAAQDVLGHPIGLAVDPITSDVYFGDIIEGRIYKSTL